MWVKIEHTHQKVNHLVRTISKPHRNDILPILGARSNRIDVVNRVLLCDVAHLVLGRLPDHLYDLHELVVTSYKNVLFFLERLFTRRKWEAASSGHNVPVNSRIKVIIVAKLELFATQNHLRKDTTEAPHVDLLIVGLLD